MELYQLRSFYEVAKLQNISQASLLLNISQPALSICIKKLETELGTKLFIRKGKSIHLSNIGYTMLPSIEKILAYEKEIFDLCKNKADINELSIEVHAAIPVVINVVSHFHQTYPEIKIKMTNDEGKDETPDLIIEATHDTDNTTVFTDHIVVAIPRILDQSFDTPIRHEFLSENTLIGISRNYSFSKVEQYFFPSLRHSIICDSPAMLRNLLNNGTGIALVPSKTWLLKKNPSIKLEKLEGPLFPVNISVKKSGYRENQKIVDLFTDELTSLFKQL